MTASEALRRRPSPHLLALGAILLAAVGLRVAWIAYVNVDPDDGRFDDTVFYYRVADSLASGGGYVDPWDGEQSAQWPPAYPALLALVFLPFGKSLIAAKTVNVLLAGVTVLLTYALGRRLFDRRVGLLAAVVIAAFPSYIFLSTLVLAENLFIPVFLLALLLILRWGLLDGPPTGFQSLIIGGVIAFAALTRSEGIWLVLPAAIVWFRAFPRRTDAVRAGLVMFIGVAILLAPWTARNAIQLNEFTPLRANVSGALGKSLNPDYRDYFSPLPFQRTQSAPTVAEDLRIYLEEPWQPIVLVGKKTFELYENDHELVEWAAREPAATGTGLAEAKLKQWKDIADATYYASGAIALAALGLGVWARDRRVLFLAAVFLTWNLGFTIVTPTTRYHLALLPLLTLLAALPAVRLLPGVDPKSEPPWRSDRPIPQAIVTVGATIALVTIGVGFREWNTPPTDLTNDEPIAVQSAPFGESISVGEFRIRPSGFELESAESYGPLAPGHIWLVIDMQVRNVSTDPVVVHPLLTAVEDAQGNQYPPFLTDRLTDRLDATVAPGEAIRGEIVYEVQERATELQFVFRPWEESEEARWFLD